MFLYNIGIFVYYLLLRVASIKHTKAKLWCSGRRGLFDRMRECVSSEDRVVWVHVASLGEFEQGRPIIEKIRSAHPEYKILLTFFSPSGYEIRKDYKEVDFVFYLPLDTPNNARKFLDIVHPEIAIFVKYEYWLNLLFEMRRRNIKSYIVSAIFRKDSIFFKSYGSSWRRALESFETIFVQDNNSKRLLEPLGFDNIVVAGDTRFDRVAMIAESVKPIPVVDLFKGGKRLFIAGSTWQQDEQLIVKLSEKYRDIKFVIVPHEIDAVHMSAISELCGDRAMLYTDAVNMAIDDDRIASAQILILDTMGMLSSLYQYGEWAYIGGGFGVGIHNTLEAATFAITIAFGPNYERFKEAKDMISLGACQSISNFSELDSWFAGQSTDEELRAKACYAAREYTSKQRGATGVIVRTIFCE